MEKIINQVKSTWDKDLIIRFLYIKLAPYFQRDLEYFLKDNIEKERQYKQGFINRCPHIVCSTLSDYYVNLFKSFGIEAEKVIANSAHIPLFALVVKGDLGAYFLDPLNDLFSNQLGIRPYFFGIIPRYNTIRRTHPELVELPKQYIEEIDEELNIEYLDEYFEYLHKVLTIRQTAREFFGYDKNEKIDLKEDKYNFINDNLINLGNINGPFERAIFHKYLSQRILNHTERRFTTITLAGGKENPHVEVDIKVNGKIITYEEKHDKKYSLKKK